MKFLNFLLICGFKASMHWFKTQELFIFTHDTFSVCLLSLYTFSHHYMMLCLSIVLSSSVSYLEYATFTS